MVSFTLRPLYLQRGSLRYALDKRLYEPQSQSGRGGGKESLAPVGNGTPVFAATLLTELSRIVRGWV